jgi:hypothetical protein
MYWKVPELVLRQPEEAAASGGANLSKWVEERKAMHSTHPSSA